MFFKLRIWSLFDNFANGIVRLEWKIEWLDVAINGLVDLWLQVVHMIDNDSVRWLIIWFEKYLLTSLVVHHLVWRHQSALVVLSGLLLLRLNVLCALAPLMAICATLIDELQRAALSIPIILTRLSSNSALVDHDEFSCCVTFESSVGIRVSTLLSFILEGEGVVLADNEALIFLLQFLWLVFRHSRCLWRFQTLFIHLLGIILLVSNWVHHHQLPGRLASIRFNWLVLSPLRTTSNTITPSGISLARAVCHPLIVGLLETRHDILAAVPGRNGAFSWILATAVSFGTILLWTTLRTVSLSFPMPLVLRSRILIPLIALWMAFACLFIRADGTEVVLVESVLICAMELRLIGVVIGEVIASVINWFVVRSCLGRHEVVGTSLHFDFGGSPIDVDVNCWFGSFVPSASSEFGATSLAARLPYWLHLATPTSSAPG